MCEVRLKWRKNSFFFAAKSQKSPSGWGLRPQVHVHSHYIFNDYAPCYGFGLNLRLLGTEFVTRNLVQNIIFYVRGQRFLEKTNVSVTQKTQQIIYEKIKVKKLYTFTKQINYIAVTKTKQ